MTNIRSAVVGTIVLIILIVGGIYAYQKSIKTISDRNSSVSALSSPITRLKAQTSPTPTPQSATAQNTTIKTSPSTGQDPQNVGIQINLPAQLTKVTSPLVVFGQANVLDATVNLQIKDSNGKILGSVKTVACMAQDACQFKTNLMFTPAITQTGTIEAFANPTKLNPQPNLEIIKVIF